MVRVLQILLIVVHGLAFAQNQQLGFQIAGGKQKVQIPIEIHNNLIVVRVILNDALPLKFVVDTGVRTAILTQKAFADILQLPYSRKFSIAGAGGENIITAYIANNISLTLPGVVGRGHALLVLEEDYLELRNYLGTDVHGIIGYELFSRFIIQIDYQRKLMTLMLPEKFKPSKRFEVVPVRIQDTKPYILVPISISNEHALNAKLLVDTGASHGIMLEPYSDPRIHLPERTIDNIIGRGLGGEIMGKTGRIESIELGRYHIKKALANFPDTESYIVDSLKFTQVDRNGSIGGEILSRFVVIMNLPMEKIYLRKNSDFKKDFYFNLSGLNLKAKGSSLNVFEIDDVRPNSAGERAGVAKGDLLLRINGIPARELQLNQINGILNSRPGKKVRIEVRRNAEVKTFEVFLKDQI